MALNGLKWLKMAQNGSKWLKIIAHGLGMVGHVVRHVFIWFGLVWYGWALSKRA